MDPRDPAFLPTPEVLLADPAPDLAAIHLHLRARVDAGEVLLVGDGDRSHVEAAIRELAVAGRDMPRFDLPGLDLPDVPMPDERPPNRAMRRARKNR